MKNLFCIVFWGVVFTVAFGACEKDEPSKVDNAVTRGAGADTTKGGGIKLDTTWQGEYHYEF